jgi:hypothetical protein
MRFEILIYGKVMRNPSRLKGNTFMKSCFLFLLAASAAFAAPQDYFFARFPDSDWRPLSYGERDLTVDLGVGLWANPMPCDFDGDGDNDLLVATADVPSNGIYFFENSSGNVAHPRFKAGVWLATAKHNLTISKKGDGWELMCESAVFGEFFVGNFNATGKLAYKPTFHLGRAKQWKRYDYDGDGARDLIIGASDWRDYGWDNAFNAQGEWMQGPLHGYVYFMKNLGSNEEPVWAEAKQIEAGGAAMEVYGCPSPNLADWDGDGDLDVVLGEFMDKCTYFENTGTRMEPVYAAGRRLSHKGKAITMELEMLQVAAIDWDKDGDVDLVVGQEDGRVALVECVGNQSDGTPAFLPPVFFQQEAARLKVGVLNTPKSVDWDGDGDEDLIVGDTAGFVNFVENLDGGNPPQWAPPVRLKSAGETLRILAGPNGSIQGPAEAKWGYTVVDVADWDHDGNLDVVLNSIWGKVLWYRNAQGVGALELEAARAVEVAWEGPTPKPAWFWWNPKGKALVTQWRTSPVVRDLNEDGLNDLIMLDQEGYLSFFERKRTDKGLLLLPPQRIFLNEKGEALRLNEREAGGSGRRKLTMTDWDGDGKLDILINSKNIDFLRNIGDADHPYQFKNEGKVDPHPLAGHTTCPTTVDWNKDGVPDLLTGAEDGFFYYLENNAG